ncbi:hypothetical protein ARTSIC4J27_217 [Pseudarthrobacter siccitolerans]|uniref:Uncharacterized protein n=1 Tax=Pseudarthrobacter siccitolerans TaxID=861266 RepID=A0A024GWZ0_9MICC|nr:hypothetical protein [Pseudarthrobacter siccitolerans]CCQ44293.1 hypothetical protein ARTSIC4J27_217 [Pseudarthrobacter siccitolerans]
MADLIELDLRSRISSLYREHPALNGIDPSGYCCAECFKHDLAGAYGWSAVDAWEQIQTLQTRLALGGK